MLSITKILNGASHYGDQLRYLNQSKKHLHGVSTGYGPVVSWNITKSCNLKCIHCYMNSENKAYEGELSNQEAIKLIKELGAFKVPVILFTGGEPLVREDFFQLAELAAENGIRPTVSTNGTLITPSVANKLKKIGVGYVGISLDGLSETHDAFRQKKGAFNDAVRGIESCISVGQRVGLRFTINKHNYKELDAIFDFIEEANIDRVCFYHLVYSGRGNNIMKDDINHLETRAALDTIITRTLDFHNRGLNKEVLTVDNHADGVYLYLKLKKLIPSRAEEAYRLLQLNGGNRSGIAFGNIDSFGNVHPDQFTQNHFLGNVKEQSFGDIWCNMKNPILSGLKNRGPLLKGRCSKCRWLHLCNGNFRARAEAVSGDFWAEDPACYLTDEEIYS